MSPVELLRRRMQRRAAVLAPELRLALREAFEALRGEFSEAELTRLLTDVGPDRLIDQLLKDPAFARAVMQLRRVLRGGIDVAGQATAHELPARATRLVFDLLSPRVLEGIRTLETQVITALRDEIRETVRAVVTAGLEEGVGPRTTAREIRATLGLAPNQEAAVRNFRQQLETGDRTALARALRDRRFDATLARALGPEGRGLSAAQVDQMVAAYRRRFVAFHAETIARTMALDAQKLAQRLTWQQAVERGFIDGTRLMKRWATVRDDRVRPEHQLMEGEVVGHDEPFSNGEQIPGESTYNCRCLAMYFTALDPAHARRPGRGAVGAAA